jgi:hypothetical protein
MVPQRNNHLHPHYGLGAAPRAIEDVRFNAAARAANYLMRRRQI